MTDELVLITMVDAYTELSRLLETTLCSFRLTEVGGVGREICCAITVTRYAPPNEFPAYDEEICQLKTQSWAQLVECMREKVHSGEIPED